MGKCNVTFKLGKREITEDFAVVKDMSLHAHFLMGYPSMASHGISLIPSKFGITFGKEFIPHVRVKYARVPPPPCPVIASQPPPQPPDTRSDVNKPPGVYAEHAHMCKDDSHTRTPEHDETVSPDLTYTDRLPPKEIMKRLKDNDINPVFLSTSMVVPPGEYVRLPLTAKYKGTEDLMILPEYEKVKGLTLTPAMYDYDDNGQIFVEAVNLRNAPVHLKKGTTVGCAEFFHYPVVTVSESSNNINVPVHCTQSDAERIAEDVGNIDFPEAKEKIMRLLTKYRSVIALEGDNLGCTQVITHRINVPGDQPPLYIPAYRIPHSRRTAVNECVQNMLDEGIIAPSSSPWNFPIIMVPKSDGSWRLVVDFRRLNELTVPDRYPCTHMGDLLSSLGSNKYFTSLDLMQGFLQVPLHDESKELTAFSTERGHFHYTRMPYGLRSSPITFTRLINTVFHGLLGTVLFAYMDDIIIPSQTLDEHLAKLELVLQRLAEAKLKIKLKKCRFLRKEVQYLGHKISHHGIEVTDEKVKSITNYPVPSNCRQLKSFLGLAGFYRAYVSKYASVAAPLTDLLKQDVPFVWGERQQTAFDTLKKALTNPPVLAHPDFEKDFYLVTDASDKGIGSCLMQKYQDKFRPIAYYSHKLRTSAEINNSSADKESLAIVDSLKHFRYIIYGYKVTVLTDNSAATEMFKNPNLSGKRARWFVTVQDFDVNIRYIPGKSNVIADCLSRIPSEVPQTNVFAIKELSWTKDLLVKEQDSDPLLGPIKKYLSLPVESREPKTFDIPIDKLRL